MKHGEARLSPGLNTDHEYENMKRYDNPRAQRLTLAITAIVFTKVLVYMVGWKYGRTATFAETIGYPFLWALLTYATFRLVYWTIDEFGKNQTSPSNQ